MRCPHRRSLPESVLPDCSVLALERPVPIRGKDATVRVPRNVMITETTVVLAPSTGMVAASIRLVADARRSRRSGSGKGQSPGGQLKFLHLWPVKFLRARLMDYASCDVSRAMRAAASFSR